MKKEYSLKDLARIKLHSAIKSGKIKKENCAVCNSEKSEGHHKNYLKPLEVIWLCSLHHKEKHKRIKYMKTFNTKPGKIYIKERRDEIIWLLAYEGYTSGDISEFMNGLDRTWITRIIKKRPENWEPSLSTHKKAN